MYTLQNDLLKIAIKQTGAELCEISSVKHKTDFMWDANPDVWGSFAPNLFPIIGSMKNDSYIYNNSTYKMPKHGFLRHNADVKLIENTNNSLTFKLAYNDDLYKLFPFKFEFYITYELIDNTLYLKHLIKNIDNKPMFFSLGGHPAFKCPVFSDEVYSDYHLVFEQNESAETYLLNMSNGLLTSKTRPVFNGGNKIQLQHNLFNNDALIFKDLKSRKVTLNSKNRGDILTMKFNDFPYLGIWAKPNANYVCIEPWQGIADHEDTNQDIVTKEGIVELDENTSYQAIYSIEIDLNHLV